MRAKGEDSSVKITTEERMEQRNRGHFEECCQVPSNRNFMLSSDEKVVSIPMGKSQLQP